MSRHHGRRSAAALLALLLLVALAAAVSLSLGAVRVPLGQVLRAAVGLGSESADLIVLKLRLPRILAAILVGAALAVAGALLQGVVRNPLASPDLAGVTGGASVAVVGFMTLFSGYSIHLVPFVAVAGAFVVVAIHYALSWKKGVTPMRFVLIGIGLSTALSALTMFLLISGPAYLAAQVLNWMTGSIYGTNWTYIGMLWPWLAVFLPLSLRIARELNVQALGDATAIGLGSRLQWSRMAALLCSVALAGASVGVAGTLSFVGLLAPHIARRLVGHDYRLVIPASALAGALVLLAADLAGRMLFQPMDIPAGVFTAGIGAPFFMYLLLRGRRA
ncbi:FecCD family ABC transporter permease [Cohnella fermenti]|uniref:Iron ABC transporter permease n=1 Tax=Cohnella fermenti TaxID=2565925 RepID=A0A4S4BLU9_9BACL|nr:iron ABC transporter permease [Cohnella fermenti]THF75768.1 iron ABC transporter permease [Cohnella fermenti]